MVSDDLKEKEPQIPWKAWCGIRDIFAYQYDNLNHEIAWNTIQRDLPELKVECERILNRKYLSDRIWELTKADGTQVSGE